MSCIRAASATQSSPSGQGRFWKGMALAVPLSAQQKGALAAAVQLNAGFRADVAQLVEHSLGKGEVISSILIIGSRFDVARGGRVLGRARL